MHDAHAGAVPAREEGEWIDLLAPFRHGSPFIPCPLTPDGDGRSQVHAAATVPSGAADRLALPAFVLAASRCGAENPLLVAIPAGSGLSFAVCSVDDERSADDYVSEVSSLVDAARVAGPCPFEWIGTRLGLDASDRRHAYLQLGYVSQPAAALVDDAALCLVARPTRTGLALALHVDRSRYAAAFAEQLLDQTVRAIAWLASAGAARLGDADLLTPAARRQVVIEFNGTAAPRREGLTLHGLCAAQAGRTPDATAVIYRDQALTYAEVEAQARRLATSLRRHYGVRPGDLVGVMVERSTQMVPALLGIMKAGAAYVPINPRHPWDTIRYMVENAGISVLVVDAETINAAALFTGQMAVLDMELRGGGTDDDTPVPDTSLAYVIYTSGSTGRPKGVAVEHRAIVNSILWRNAFYGLTAGDVNLQIPSFAFDSSVLDIFCVLSVGGTLVLPEGDLRLDARYLRTLIARHRVSTCIVTPSYYTLLVPELQGAGDSLRCVTLAGETTSADLVAAHLRHLPGVGLYNEYGPTENAVCSTACRIDAVEPTTSIGRPIDNVQVFVLDRQGRPCAIGVPGEIHLGGAGLARGYVNQPELTAERFVASPLTEHAGRLYRTGDRACWRPDGSLEFLGRLDGQVKIRGHRIELAEVEIALLEHDGVRNAAVLCKEDPGGARYLAAYADLHEGTTRTALQEHLRGRLPSYMVPDVLAVLPRLPLTVNGKVDRQGLAALDDFATEASSARMPMTKAESGLLPLAADVLKRPDLSLDDNFFELGGNSLRVMELTSRIRATLPFQVELLDIYAFPTIRELAASLSQRRGQGATAQRA